MFATDKIGSYGKKYSSIVLVSGSEKESDELCVARAFTKGVTGINESPEYSFLYYVEVARPINMVG